LTPQEFAKTHLNLEVPILDRIKAKATPRLPKGNNAPDNWDWREKGVVSQVKSQGMCGSCWAFSAVGNIEARFTIKTNSSVLFSEQQLVDCDKVDQGCNGGLMEDAYKYLENDGLMTSADYPYTGKNDKCSYNKDNVSAKITGYHYAGTTDEAKIRQLLFEEGPFAIAINATPLQFYFWGIFNPWWEWICSPKQLNHGVLIVGYGISGKTPYWIVKNSWGAHWGEKGYFRIIANKGACGLNTYVISAEVDKK